MKKIVGALVVSLIVAVGISMCATAGYQHKVKAAAKLVAADHLKVKGKVQFEQVGDEVRVTGKIDNLTPGEHGMHIHENGVCNTADFSSAGSHFNPTHLHHGSPATSGKHHAGDFGNVVADKHGRASFAFTSKDISLTSGKTSIVGKVIVIHEKVDDLKSQPAGNSGARIACGVIQLR